MHSGTIALLVCLASSISCMEHVYMEHAKMEDQASSGTGYSYSSDSGEPGKYITYSDTSGDYEHMMYPYAPGLSGYYEYHHIPTYDDPSLHYVPSYYLEAPYTSYGYPSAFSDYNKYGNGYWNQDSDSYGGKEYEESEHSSKGEKGEDAFKKLFGWDKESEGKHENEQNKGWYGAQGANKKGHEDSEKHWQSHEAGGKAVEGESFKVAKGHKKGEKTTGYHKVYHKDEFKKDHEFYDQEDRKGEFDKYGQHDEAHEDVDGAFKAGEGHKSGYHQDESGKKGYSDQSYHVDKDDEHESNHGEHLFHKDFEDYAKKEGEDKGSEHGEKEHWHY